MSPLLLKTVHANALQGRKAMVFGASAGIGFACAETLAAMGAEVLMVARDELRLQQAAQRIKASGYSLPATHACDITDVAALQQLLEQHENTQILISNCGGPPVAAFDSLMLEQWESAWQSQLRSVIQASQMLVPKMAEQGWGRVLMLASVTLVQPMRGFALSNSIRPGLAGLAATLTQEYADRGVTANVLCPGITRTGRIEKLARQSLSEGQSLEQLLQQWAEEIPLKRLADAEEIAAMAGFLVSDAAAFISGQAFVIDGGQSVAG